MPAMKSRDDLGNICFSTQRNFFHSVFDFTAKTLPKISLSCIRVSARCNMINDDINNNACSRTDLSTIKEEMVSTYSLLSRNVIRSGSVELLHIHKPGTNAVQQDSIIAAPESTIDDQKITIGILSQVPHCHVRSLTDTNVKLFDNRGIKIIGRKESSKQSLPEPDLLDLEELMPGQPWGISVASRMHCQSNEQIKSYLLAMPTIEEVDTHPEDLLHKILKERGYLYEVMPTLESEFHISPTNDQISSYSSELVAAVRESNLKALREFRDAGRSMSACNRFGESILHIACRRGNIEVLSFLLNNGAVPGICDDCGRTPLHDALWTSEPRFDVVTLLLNWDLRLLRCLDKRGSSPLQYVRREHWDIWCSFFHSKKHLYWADLKGRPDLAGIIKKPAPEESQ